MIPVGDGVAAYGGIKMGKAIRAKYKLDQAKAKIDQVKYKLDEANAHMNDLNARQKRLLKRLIMMERCRQSFSSSCKMELTLVYHLKSRSQGVRVSVP